MARSQDNQTDASEDIRTPAQGAAGADKVLPADPKADPRALGAPMPATAKGPGVAFAGPEWMPMTQADRARLQALRDKDALTDSEQAEFDGLSGREAFDANRPEQKPMAVEDYDRLRLLRSRAANPQLPNLSEDEEGEMQTLSLVESEAAGHVTPPARESVDDIHPHLQLSDELLAAIEHIVSLIPALRGLSPRLTWLRTRIDEMKGPVPEDQKKVA
jgi:hypothetical protein